MGRVRQVGPPPPLRPISAASKAWTSHPAASSARRVRGFRRRRPDPGPDRQDVAAERRELLLGDGDKPDPQLTQQFPEAGRQERHVDHSEVVGDRRDDRQEVEQLLGPVPVGQVEDAGLAPGAVASELPGSRIGGAQAAADAQQVRPQPERVAAIDRARCLDRADGGDVMVGHPAGEDRRPRAPARSAAAERDGAPVGHEQRIERVDVVGAARFRRRAPPPAPPASSTGSPARRALAAPAAGRRGAGSRAPGRRTPARRPRLVASRALGGAAPPCSAPRTFAGSTVAPGPHARHRSSLIQWRTRKRRVRRRRSSAERGHMRRETRHQPDPPLRC